ncbi:hypothetical protein ACFE04_018086 [Oxalis oulophora]
MGKSNSQNPSIDPMAHLPLSMFRSDTVPPAPTRSINSIDWIPNFAGYSWVAYGASSLLVISHIPSPLSNAETIIGPILRQVLDLSTDVTAVSWSPATPSVGELAAASGNCICVFLHDSNSSSGSFCWSQNAVLVQSTKVEAIKWTGSGDGIIAGGNEVCLWKRKDKHWEIAWKCKRDYSHNLVSSTWSIDGPSAAAASLNDMSRSVLVCHIDKTSEYVKSELRHPLTVSMIQWRPSAGKQTKENRHVLLTCSLDGAVRLWCEIGSGKAKKSSRSFFVSAVIEINQVCKGTLGTDIFITWAVEIGGISKPREGGNQRFTDKKDDNENIGCCEWLIGFGPGMLLTYWAIHCLDDISPLRFPRVTLWKKLALQGFEGSSIYGSVDPNGSGDLFLHKVVISRNHYSGPPASCSLIRLSSVNSLACSVLYTPTSSITEDNSFLTSSGSGVLNISGHTARLLQISVHPYICESQLAVSLDSNGLLLFWSFSTISNCISELPALVPTWKICGKLITQDSCSKYTSLNWAPSVLGEDRVLLMGHVGGIDCFIVKITQKEGEDIICHYICTIPFTGHGPFEKGPSKIFVVPLPSTCTKTFDYNKFLIVGIWTKSFHALSWEITLHSYSLSETSCQCTFSDAESSMWKYEDTFAGKRYCLIIDPCSSSLPELHAQDQVTSSAVVCPSSLTPLQHNLASTDNLCSYNPAYVMATGHSGGKLKLWKSKPAEQKNSSVLWELVGIIFAHEGPVNAISLSDCGLKIATVSVEKNPSSVSTIHIWNPINLKGEGSFVLEDTLSIHKEVIDLSWLTLGNGQLLLGVCLQNGLQVYAQKRSCIQTLPKTEKSQKTCVWSCIAESLTCSPICDFFWGPRGTAVVLHDSYFSLFGQWLFLLDNRHPSNSIVKDLCYEGKIEKDVLPGMFTDFFVDDFEKPLSENGKGLKSEMKHDRLSGSLHETMAKNGPCAILSVWSLQDIVNELSGSLPVYHPEALLMNIHTGNWNRAFISLRHLVGSLTHDQDFERRYSFTKSSHAVPQILFSDYFESPVTKSSPKDFQWSGGANLSSSQFQGGSSPFSFNLESYASNSMSSPSSTKSELSDFVEPIEKFYELAGINNTEKVQMLAVVDLLSEVGNKSSTSPYENLDEPGRRSARVEELKVDSRLIAWAFHCDCQDTLINSVLPSEPSWLEMQTLGIGYWFADATQLRTRMEKLARQQYLKKRDPKDCALLYVALNRIQVLAGLFKISKNEKDKPLVAFLSRNFQEEKNKAAALKNAYVLMGRHQLELAVAFFLLGGDHSSAVTICAKNLGDEQLALVICQLLEGVGGSLERHITTKFILPAAIEKSDGWRASLLEWKLGNYSESFLRLLCFRLDSLIDKPTFPSNHVSFEDPSVGQYCLMLSNKNKMKNAIGEQHAALLARWACVMTATVLGSCGLPLEALECLSSTLSMHGARDQESISDNRHSLSLSGILKPSSVDSSNWLSGDVASVLESHAKLNIALQYVSKLMMEHPSWPGSFQTSPCYKDYEIHHYKKLFEDFRFKLYTELKQVDQKFFVPLDNIVHMVMISLYNNGLSFIGYDMFHQCVDQGQAQGESQTIRTFLKASEDISVLFSRFVAACAITGTQGKAKYTNNTVSCKLISNGLNTWDLRGIILSLWRLKSAMTNLSGCLMEDVVMKLLGVLDLVEYFVNVASAWLQRNAKVLLIMVQPILITLSNGHTPYEVDMVNLLKLCPWSAEFESVNHFANAAQDRECENTHSIPEEERWEVIGACLWYHMSKFMKQKFDLMSINLDDSSSDILLSKIFSSVGNNTTDQIKMLSLTLAKLVKVTSDHIAAYHLKELMSFLQQKVELNLFVPTILWLNYNTKVLHQDQGTLSEDVINHQNENLPLDMLWDICADPGIIIEGFGQENVNWSHYLKPENCKGWKDKYKGITDRHQTENNNHEGNNPSTSNAPADDKAGVPAKSLFGNGNFLSSWQKETTITMDLTSFHTPKEICKRNGELLEAMCINSINQSQAALASNKKGINFFTWDDENHFREQPNYIWSDADWPHNGWAGSESTPVPTCVSPGIGLGSKKGTHLGLGGATVGVSSPLARPGRDLTGGGAFGVPGYAGMGASGLGWEIQEDFEEFVDPPATVDNIRTRAFSSHPSMPFFLVGSNNTHIYLWEFGKDKATATYGVLPVANVPPPYALASISSLHFDHFGHRFASAALDGTVCTWQLEVGGRSNIHPTESSLCFNSHASDVTYVTSSGSVIAAAGYSSNDVNVVMWDTLAPPSTSRASLICHEGGARSISVFDNNIGSGSVSPFIVTGGKGGDVGVHDFRYIATGKTKRNKHSDNGESSLNPSNTVVQTGTGNKSGDQNVNGMLWYIPKAHLGSVTKISTIPNTSLFLTGSKDGDVKLWDAKASKLVYHWPKLHERHTFLQPSSRGFGGVVRVAVTDIQVVSQGFLTCGGDGSVKLVELKDHWHGT